MALDHFSKEIRDMSRAIVFVAAFVLGLALRASELEDTIKKLPAQDRAARDAANAVLFKDAAANVAALAKLLGEPGKGDDKARVALHAMAVHASRPGGDADRKAFAQAASAALGDGGNSSGGKIYLLTQLRLTAGDEQVEQIAKALGEKELSEHAAQTLITIGSSAAKGALRGALGNVKGSERVNVIAALGALRDKEAAGGIAKDIESAEPEVKDAALHALANIGDASAAPALKKAADAAGEDKWYEHNQITQAQITLAQRMVESGNKDAAVALCRELIQTRNNAKERHVQCAALNILAAALGEAAFDDLKAGVKSESNEVRAAALNLASALPGEAVTKKWVGEYAGAEPAVRAQILQILQKRGDKAGWPAVEQGMKDADKGVRIAAAGAAVIGGKDALSGLIAALAKETKDNKDALPLGKETKDNDEEQAAAKASLARLKGDGINAGIVEGLKGANVQLRKALISAIADRAALEHLNVLSEATKDADASIRAVAFDALGFLGDTKTLPALIDAAVNAATDADRGPAEKAVASIASRKENSAQAITMIEAAIKSAPTRGKQGMLRVLGRIGGADALAVLKPALKDADADVVDTAARELANWPDASALETQFAVAKETQVLPHHVFNIGGYVRLLGTLKRPAGEMLNLYKGALEICRRPDEKKKVIAGLQNVKSVDALKFLEPMLEDKAVKNEALGAYYNVAKDLVRSNKNAAAAALAKVVEITTDEKRKKEAQGELDKIKK